MVEIVVADDGPGIPPEDREAIFERFFRGASRGEVEGSGLGLAIAKRAIERAGGTLRLDASVTKGTRFVIGLRAERTHTPPSRRADRTSQSTRERDREKAVEFRLTRVSFV